MMLGRVRMFMWSLGALKRNSPAPAVPDEGSGRRGPTFSGVGCLASGLPGMSLKLGSCDSIGRNGCL